MKLVTVSCDNLEGLPVFKLDSGEEVLRTTEADFASADSDQGSNAMFTRFHARLAAAGVTHVMDSFSSPAPLELHAWLVGLITHDPEMAN